MVGGGGGVEMVWEVLLLWMQVCFGRFCFFGGGVSQY